MTVTVRRLFAGFVLLLLAACSSGLESSLPQLDSGLELQNTPTTLRVPIVAASDDAEEMSHGGMDLGGGLLDFSAKNGARQTVGLRFANVNLPQGARITAAYIEMRGGLAKSGGVTLQVRGQAADNAATFTTTKHNLTSRPLTSAVATWNPNAWTQGGVVRSSSLVAVVQELVDRSGWRSGNALAFSVTGDGRAERAAIAFGGNPAYVPTLVVTFEGGGQTPPPAPEPTPEPSPTPPPASGSLTLSLASGADDAEETATGAMRTGTSTRSLDFSVEGGVAQSVGLRFTGVTVPKGSRITRAYLEFKASAADSGKVSLLLYGQAVDNAGAFTTASRNVTSRTKTSASSTWRPNAWSVGQTTRSSELKDIVQQIVDRGGWRSGNALAFIVTGDGQAKRSAVSRDASATEGPTLYLTYEPAQQTPPPTPEPEPTPPPPAPEPEPTPPPPTPEPEPAPPPSGDIDLWRNRLVATIDNPQYGSGNAWMNPITQADSGDLYIYGYSFNNYMTTLMLAYGKTGDRRLLQQLDTLMNRMRTKLRDTDGDGYLNWLFLNQNADSSSAPFIGTDYHDMSEMMTHAMVAAAAYTLKQAGFDGSASFWTDYLKNHFEAKWRARKNKPSGYPFLTKELMHPYAQFIRYHYYMGKLTGESSYTTEARRMAGVVKQHMIETDTPSGTGYEWNHRINDGKNLSKLGCQATVYVRLTTQAMADLATQDTGLFDTTFMRRVANTMAHKVLLNSDGSQLAGNICGEGTYGNLYNFVAYPYSQLARWDVSGRLQGATVRAYEATERHRMESPRIYNLPAMMVFSLGR